MHNPLDAPGRWFKGNLHTHSTNSDGELSPQELVDLYADAGYDFLAITDHGKLTPTDDLDPRGLLLLPGSELHQGKGELGQTHHLVAIGQAEPIEIPPTDDYHEAIRYVADRCEFCFTAHPYWTSLTHLDMLGMPEQVGLEVYNFTCHRGIGRGESAVHWDQLLARGDRLWGFAVDDAHCHYDDALGGWIMVRAPECTAEAIYAAIKAGAFYASSGPAIEDIALGENEVSVKCSPCREVAVIAPMPGIGTTTWRPDYPGGPYTEVRLSYNPEWPCFRLECIDEHGHKAWSNPFYRD